MTLRVNPFVRSQTGGQLPPPPPIACAITSPSNSAHLTQGIPVTITGTISIPGTVVVLSGTTPLGAATISGLNWSYTWTPQSGDVGVQAINATAAAGAATGFAVPVSVLVGAAFNGDFTQFFTGASAAWQPHLQLTYAATMVATGTGTPPVLTLSTPPTTPCAVRVEVVAGGARGTWTGRISYDSPTEGGGTFTQTFTSAATVNLTGAGAGGVISIAAGTAGTDNVWRATKSQVNDTTGHARHMVQATAAKQAIVTPGLNGHIGIEWDGSDDVSTAAVTPVANSSNGAMFRWIAGRNRTFTTGGAMLWGTQAIVQGSSDPSVAALFGVSTATLPTNTFGLVEVGENNAPTDYIRAGSASGVVALCPTQGNGNGYFFGASDASGTRANRWEALTIIDLPARPTDAQLAAARAAAKTFWGGSFNA